MIYMKNLKRKLRKNEKGAITNYILFTSVLAPIYICNNSFKRTIKGIKK